MERVFQFGTGGNGEQSQIHAASAALDMAAPLSIISGAATALQDDCPASERQARVSCILRNAHLLQTLVEELYGGAPFELGELQFEELDLAEVVREVVADFATIAQSHPLHFYGDSAWVLGDSQRIKRLVFILISNAMKHSKRGREVKVDVWRRGANVCLFVQDEGETSTSSSTERVFLPFTRLDEKKGLCSGDEIRLASVKRICDAHGATLRVQGIPGHGTIFEVCFKARQHAAETLIAEAKAPC